MTLYNYIVEIRIIYCYTIINNQSQSDEKTFEIPGFVLANDGKYYEYNAEINGVYYCPGNVVITDREPKIAIAPEKGIIIDNFCLDLENKKIEVKKAEGKGKTIKIYLKGKEFPAILGINENNQIIKYENRYLEQVGDDFLHFNMTLSELNLPQLQQVGDNFLRYNEGIMKLNLPQLQQVKGSNFFVK